MAEYPSRPGHDALGTIQVPWMLSGPAILARYPAQFAYAAGLTGAGRTVAFGRTMTLLSGVACLGAACAARALVVGVLLAPRIVAGFVEPFVAVETWRADEGVAVTFFAPALFGVAFFGAAFFDVALAAGWAGCEAPAMADGALSAAMAATTLAEASVRWRMDKTCHSFGWTAGPLQPIHAGTGRHRRRAEARGADGDGPLFTGGASCSPPGVIGPRVAP